MPDLSSVQPGPCMALVEATTGVQPAGFTANAAGFLTEASVNPVEGDFQYAEYLPHTDIAEEVRNLRQLSNVVDRLVL